MTEERMWTAREVMGELGVSRARLYQMEVRREIVSSGKDKATGSLLFRDAWVKRAKETMAKERGPNMTTRPGGQ